MAVYVDNPASSVDNSSVSTIWSQCLDIIQEKIHPQSFQTWFKPVVPIKMEGNVLFLQVPSHFFYEWLEEHYAEIVRISVRSALGDEANIEYIILKHETIEEDYTNEIKVKQTSTFMGEETYLNSRYNFNTYVEGSSNQFARAAAMAVAEAPGSTSFNPLVIYGGVGLGKTHLIQAIGNHAREHNSATRIRYVSSEKFTLDFINSIQKNIATEFSKLYRGVDLLLVDDIQFFMNKERTQEEFFHTFNTLHHKGKQIVLSSDRPPKELKGLEERLISRFQWGLSVDIQPPDLETRIAILRQRAEFEGVSLSMQIVEYIATNITSNIRELEGALIKLLAFSSLKGVDVDLDLSKLILKDAFINKKLDITIDCIQRVICAYYDIPDDLLRGKTRKKEVVFARQLAMYLCKEMTHFSLKSIGLHFGGRDHTTVIHAIRTIDKLKSASDSDKINETVGLLKKKVEMAAL